MNIWIKRAALAAGAVAFIGVAGAGVTLAQGDAIKQRQAVMKGNGESMKALKAVVDAKSAPGAVAPEAAKVAAALKAFPGHFPSGSDKGETKAAPDIWKDMADFRKHADATVSAAMKLEASAKKGDAAAFAADFGELGKTCGACHNKYRLK
ncbi:MAG: c-type cytochrome [Rhodospirillales bacterium]